MKKLSLLLLFLVVACSKTEPKLFTHDAVSFTIPGDWKIEQEPITEVGYYVAAQKEGFSSSGLFTLTWVNGELNLDENVKVYQEELRNNAVYKSSNLVFTATKLGKFAGHETISTGFSAKILTVGHHGTIHSFLHNGITYTILIQEADDDADDNQEGFDMIEKTLVIKG
ncbi:MAG: hypothetical protein EOO50_16030 [Flavobacterium sp.]|uniref:hypothetical protein n=1 Tax=Flavobacterium sp. TaxID=239 RepID=UPI0012013726|nr:hypothetical protein [Flavobacterium sp.]RZJ64308.1 MAG: hypothetical protein EOO50_16030 [Flavobacterium sp.]